MGKIKALIELYKLLRHGITVDRLRGVMLLEEIGRQAIKEKYKGGFDDVQVGDIRIHWRDCAAICEEIKKGH
jgi:hypothetical protein